MADLTNRHLTMKTWWAASALLLVTVLLFGHTLTHPFMMDDRALIVRNDSLTDKGFLQLDVLSSGEGRVKGGEYVYFRPVAQILVALPAHLFGKNPFAYRLTNLALFYLVCLSLFALVNSLFKDTNLAFLTAVLFCVHPMNGVLVNYVTATGFSVLVLAVSWGLICYLESGNGRKRPWLIGLSVVLYILALLCHETAVAFPLYLFAALSIVRKHPLKVAVRGCLPFIIITIFYAVFRQYYAVYSMDIAARLDIIGTTVAGYSAAFFNCILWYLKGLVTAQDVVLMWASPLIHDRLVLWNFGLLIFLACVVYLCARWRGELQLGLCWMVAGLLPVGLACISRPSFGIIIEPHWLFFPTVGFCVIVAKLIFGVRERMARPLRVVLMILIIAGYAAATLRYNRLWSDEKVYNQYLIALSPNVSIFNFWLADAYMAGNEFRKAKHYYLRSLNGDKSDWIAYTNIGLIEDRAGNRKKAKEYYYKAISLDPTASEVKNNLAAVYIEEKDYEKARYLLVEILRRDKSYNVARKNLVTLYTHLGLKQQARMAIREILAIDPDDPDVPEMIKRLEQ